ncbi:MAG: hypothetical protein JSW71_04630 [Gemmatimonadota bacterium]|nr:MAG: hypothetical protein JSW71_04630 [Gemmatimonadota bacterium]
MSTNVEDDYELREGIDVDAGLEVLQELILEQGEVVFESCWDSGAPGAGAGTEVLYLFRDLYWPCSSTFGLSGPCGSLDEALGGDLGAITDATERIRSIPEVAERVASHLRVVGAPRGKRILINDEAWEVSSSGTLRRVV